MQETCDRVLPHESMRGGIPTQSLLENRRTTSTAMPGFAMPYGTHDRNATADVLAAGQRQQCSGELDPGVEEIFEAGRPQMQDSQGKKSAPGQKLLDDFLHAAHLSHISDAGLDDRRTDTPQQSLEHFAQTRPLLHSDLHSTSPVAASISSPVSTGSVNPICLRNLEQFAAVQFAREAKYADRVIASWKRENARNTQQAAAKERRHAECRQVWQVSESEKDHAHTTSAPASRLLRFESLAPDGFYHFTYASRPRLFTRDAQRNLVLRAKKDIAKKIPELPEKDKSYYMGGKMTDTLPLHKVTSPARAPTPEWIDTPAHIATDHGLLSNLRDGVEEPATNNDTRAHAANNIFDQPALPYSNAHPDVSMDMSQLSEQAQASQLEEPTTPFVEGPTQSEVATEDNGAEEEIKEHRAYAMLKFADSYAYINSLNLVITRDEEYYRRWQAEKKDEKKRAKLEGRANDALQGYRQEPSQPSQPGDEDRREHSSRSGEGEALEGRPAPSLLSNYSESGGAVGFHSDDGHRFEVGEFRHVRRNNGHSSSAASIDPANLHYVPPTDITHLTTHYSDDQGLEGHPRVWAALPVHPAVKEDIKKISREHMIFSYDTEKERWVMKVLGKSGVILNDEHHPVGTDGITLSNGDELWIATLQMIFLLPQHDDGESEDVMDSVEEIPVSPASRPIDEGESDEEDARPLAEARDPPKKKSIKIKISNRKKDKLAEEEPPKGKGKGKTKNKAGNDKNEDANDTTKLKEEPSTEAAEPEKKSKSTEKGKKPKAAAPTASDANAAVTESSQEPKSEAPKANQGSPPTVPIPTDPNSAIHGLSQDQMPEKRKGPGRPPKNGVLSKRDDAGVKRKMKEYERKGLPCPPLKDMLDEVRREQRAKDLAAKAAARGETVQDTPLPSIEPGAHRESDAATNPLPQESNGLQSGSPTAPADRGSPRPRPRIRSPSPIKPESEFTEEELKKPTITYIYIIDEILQSIEGGQADLQTIYDKIQKRWPFFKYKVSSIGWQSSVRHNLLSCDRFKEAGKSGKGKFWTINHEVALDNKKKRPTPPPRPPPMPMANGQMPPGMPPNAYGQPGFPGSFPLNGQGAYNANGQQGHGYYNSPYGSGPNGGYGPPPSGSAPMQQNRQPSNGPYQRQGPHPPQRQPSQQPPQQKQPQLPFQQIVNEMLVFRTTWLQGLAPGSPEYSEREASFLSAMNHYSAVYHGGSAEETSEEKLRTEPFPSIKAIFDRYPAQNSPAQASAPPSGSENATTASATQQIGANSAPLPTVGAAAQAQAVPQANPAATSAPSNGQLGQTQEGSGNVHVQPGSNAPQQQPPGAPMQQLHQTSNAPIAHAVPQTSAPSAQPSETQVFTAPHQHQVPASSETPVVPPSVSRPLSHPQPGGPAQHSQQSEGSIPSATDATDLDRKVEGSVGSTADATAAAAPSISMNQEQEKKASPTQVPIPVPAASQQDQPSVSGDGGSQAPQTEPPIPAASGTKRPAGDMENSEEDPEAKRQKTS